MAFATSGVGTLLAEMFDRELLPDLSAPERRGKSLLMAIDIGGSHAGPRFETYSFLILDLDRNAAWLGAQREFRGRVLRSSRRMAFKTLNDKLRRNALLPFLTMGKGIAGWLVTFVVSKSEPSLFQPSPRTPEIADKLAVWKRPVQERLLRVLHLSAFLLSGLSVPQQDVLWIIDQDEVASNVGQLTRLTDLLGSIASCSLAHDLGHIRCATAKSDDGTRAIEDLLAYCDLAAGAVSEITTAMAGGHRYLQEHIVAPLPTGVSWKARTILSWLAARTGDLRHLTCLVELRNEAPAMRAQFLRWHAVPHISPSDAGLMALTHYAF